MPHLTKAQTRGLAEWTYGTATAGSGCLTAVVKAVAALTVMGKAAAIRQRLRERLLDGADRARPSPNQIDARACFVPLMRRVLSMWKSDSLALAIDPLIKCAMWRRIWLLPEPWPPPPDGVAVICRPKPQNIPL